MATASERLAQGPNVAARAGFESATLRSKGIAIPIRHHAPEYVVDAVVVNDDDGDKQTDEEKDDDDVVGIIVDDNWVSDDNNNDDVCLFAISATDASKI